MKKAQAAMEFLMTYGWAILVVLVAIAALAYFGVLNPGRFLPNSCTIGSGISCEDFKVKADDNLILLLRNGMGENAGSVTVAVGTCTASLEADGGDSWTDGEILGGADGIELTACGTLSSGDRYKADVTVTYTPTGGLSHVKKGSITTKVE